MRYKITSIIIAVSLSLISMPFVAFASDITEAEYRGVVQVTENGTALTDNTATVFSGNLTDYLNATFTDASLQYNGSDVAFMPPPPGSSTWAAFISNIGQSQALDYDLYLQSATGGKIRFFGSMLIADDASIEITDNFTGELKGFIDTETAGNLIYKADALTVSSDGSGNITATLTNEGIEQNYIAVDDENDGIYTVDWRAQTFTTVGAYTAGYVKLKANTVDTPGNVTISIKATTAGKPSGADLSALVFPATDWPGVAAWVTVDIPDVALSATTMYAVVFRVSGGNPDYINWRRDGSGPTFAGGTRVFSGDSGGTWTIDATKDFMFEVWAYDEASATASGVTVGEHTVEAWADTVNIGIDIDGSTEDSTALGGVSARDNSNNWVIGSDATPYIESASIAIDGTPKSAWAWENNTTLHDSIGSNDATTTPRTVTSKLNVTAALTNLSPITQARASTFSLGGISDIFTTVPEDIPQMYAEGDYSKIPAGAAINAVLDEGVVPRALWWHFFLFGITCIIMFLVYGATTLRAYQGRIIDNGDQGSLLLMSIVGMVVLALLGIMGPIPFWPALLFPIWALAIIMSQKHQSYG